MLDDHRIANGDAPFNSFAAFRASELDTRQTPGSDAFNSEIDPITGTDHPSLKSLSFTVEFAVEARFTGFQPAAGVGSSEYCGATAPNVFERFVNISTVQVAVLSCCCATGINDASAPERSSSNSCGMSSRSSAEKPLGEERADGAATRRAATRRETMHTNWNQCQHNSMANRQN